MQKFSEFADTRAEHEVLVNAVHHRMKQLDTDHPNAHMTGDVYKEKQHLKKLHGKLSARL